MPGIVATSTQPSKVCPFCAEQIAANAIKCKHCGSALVPLSGLTGPARQSLSVIKAPLLVSAISNILVGLFWLSLCFGVIFAVPMFILCIFEFILFAKADDLEPEELASQAQVVAIFEIVVGLFNTFALICGIIVLVNAPAIKRRAGHPSP